ncbi:DJ-1/PfpI/YhbO family deglycase/protease [Oscillatoria sp. FACHB-1407]|uniref:DJ-1/PfpI/YhbO family deglycase/protease n=1 Tax=Oscillatoria sp. FACHB-1407 TaxID=2692847 RepID=UPI001689E984|nr:DJ-1/PfpI/YhbO family deglycase/protease [Oscillatoria sp. FACHB-1407]MBD2460308.1 DJ-1/PfpI/YhbO family deglycase/protease [Oscillatoria sp. FACHB-1407]
MTENGQTRKKRVAILIEQKVEDAEFQIPYNALRKAGAEVIVLGSRVNEEYKGKQGKLSIKADGTTTESRAEDFDAVIIPGGFAPDKMRTNMKTVRFVQDAMAKDIWVAAICHGPQVLIEGDLLKGKEATGFRSIRKDLQNAGVEFVDQPLVVDGNLITSRRPGDLPIFTTAILQVLDLTVPDTTLPDVSDTNAGWWKLGEEWGGSTKSEIVDAINIAIGGERYAYEAFETYSGKASDPEVKSILEGVRDFKAKHIQWLENRLDVLGEKPSLRADVSGAYADLKTWLQSINSDVEVLKRALGELQTGVVDVYNLRNKLTDPTTVELFDQMDVDIAKHEQWVADLYQARLIESSMQPPHPTTGAAVTA